MTPAQQALVDRWKGFLAKIDGRLDEIIAESQAGVDGLAAQFPDDTTALTNAMTGLDARVRQLREKIEETWDGQVEGKFDEQDAEGFLDLGLDMKADAELAIEEKWALWKTRAVADYHRKMEPLARAAMEKPVYCSQCGAELDLPTRRKTVSHTCPHCHAVNQVIPEAVVQLYFGAGAVAVAEAEAAPRRFEIERYREEVDRWRRAREWAPETIESMEKWERMELAYWRIYAQARAAHEEGEVDEEFVESRMKFFRKSSLETDQRWNKVHGS